MSDSVQMPALGESVTEGTVTRWLKQIGDQVEVDEPLLEVSTDKVDTEIPSPFAGVLEQILVSEDETVDIGAQLAVIGDGSAGASAPAAPAASQQPAPAAAAPAPAAPAPAPAAPAPAAPAPAAASNDGTTVSMPALGESVTEGTVTRWLKQQGEQVEVDEPLLEVSTDKVDTEIPSPVAGILQKILVNEDETVEVGAALAVVGGAGAPAPEATAAPAREATPQPQAAPVSAPPPTPAPRPAPAPAPQAAPAAPPAPRPAAAPAPQPAAAPAPQPVAAPATNGDSSHANGGSDGGPGYVTPLVRRMAAEQGVDLAAITGTGVGGRIRKQDVIDAAKAKTSAPAPAPAAIAAPAPAASSAPAKPASVSALRGTTEKMSRLRKVIATRMVESLQTSAQLTTVVEVDVTKIARLRDRAKKDFATREGVKLSFMPFFALAAVEALKQHPKLNASIEGDQVIYHAEENLSFAVDSERGLLAPVIHRAGDLNIAGLARKITDLADRTRGNKILPDEMSGGTFTLTNTGSRGALFDTPIIFLPQTAILGTGVVVKRPVVVTDEDGAESIAIRSIVYLALSYDHRLVDGADAARFLTTMKDRLEEGAFDADLGL